MWPGARVWQGATVWAVCFPCNSAVYHQGQKTAICNLQGLVTDGVSFKLVNGGGCKKQNVDTVGSKRNLLAFFLTADWPNLSDNNTQFYGAYMH